MKLGTRNQLIARLRRATTREAFERVIFSLMHSLLAGFVTAEEADDVWKAAITKQEEFDAAFDDEWVKIEKEFAALRKRANR